MAEPGHNPHPSARDGGKTERRTPRLLWLLLWAGTTFQVTLGTGPELHACKESGLYSYFLVNSKSPDKEWKDGEGTEGCQYLPVIRGIQEATTTHGPESPAQWHLIPEPSYSCVLRSFFSGTLRGGRNDLGVGGTGSILPQNKDVATIGSSNNSGLLKNLFSRTRGRQDKPWRCWSASQCDWDHTTLALGFKDSEGETPAWI